MVSWSVAVLLLLLSAERLYPGKYFTSSRPVFSDPLSEKDFQFYVDYLRSGFRIAEFTRHISNDNYFGLILCLRRNSVKFHQFHARP